MNVNCSATPCPVILNATCVFYEGAKLLYTGINTNDNLQIALQKIDETFQNAAIGYGFTNGLIQSAPNQPVMLGGALIQNTLIGGAYSLTFSGDLGAAKFITTGGTSSQFVKGDGSLDLTTYVPSSRTLTINGVTYDLSANRSWTIPAGTVTSVGVVAGIGISASVSNPTSTPVITINNTAPDRIVSLSSGSGITVTGTYPNFTITNTSPSSGGTVTTVSASSPLSSTGGTTPNISIPKANTSTNGYLSSTDWNTFNNKQDTLFLTTVGSSGVATLSGVTLNIPNYGLALSGYVPTTRTINTTSPLLGGGNLSANRTLSIALATASSNGYLSSTDWNTFNGRQPQLNGTGFVKASGTTISYDNSTYLTSISGIAAGGQLSGTYPNPSLLNSAVIGKVLTGLNVIGGSVVATDSILTAFGKVQNQINGLVGGLVYQGAWDASTNTPTLTSGVGTEGYFYITSVAGTTNLDGNADWHIGDWAVFNGSVWQLIDNTDAVTSVNGYIGAVNLTTADIPEVTNLYYTDTRARNAISGGTGISYAPLTGIITNSLPDQTVSLSNGTGISITGSYPNFTITNTSPSSGGTVTGTGTTNTLPKFTSASSIGDSNVKDDGNVVTINATAGSFGALQVGNYNGNILMNTNSSSAALIFQNTASGNKLWDFSTPGNDFAIDEANIPGAPPRMYFVAGGHVLVNSAADDLTGGQFQVTGAIQQSSVTSSMLKTSSVGVISAASAGVDYQEPITLTTTGTSGAATFIANTLNIPDYSGGGGSSIMVVDSGTCSTIRCGVSNIASGVYSSALSGQFNCAIDGYATIGGGFCNGATAYYSTIGGGITNYAGGAGSTIGGGQNNLANCLRTTISGGYNNIATSNNYASILGGRNNTASGCYSSITGGAYNTASQFGSFVGNGYNNNSTGIYSNVTSGYSNTASGFYSSVLGGKNNYAIGCASVVSGGGNNTNSGCYSSIAGGNYNTISGNYSSIVGNHNNDCSYTNSYIIGSNICATQGCTTFVNDLSVCSFTTCSGCAVCIGANGVLTATAGGGGGSIMVVDFGMGSTMRCGNANSVMGACGTVSGGSFNSANQTHAVVGGGFSNRACGSGATISGGYCNLSSYSFPFGTIGGGACNTTSSNSATISGGFSNTASNQFATVSGGCVNTASGIYSSISGGTYNTSFGQYSHIGGGSNNTANGDCSTLSGGYLNCSSGVYSFVGGGRQNSSSSYTSTISGGCFNVASNCFSAVGGGKGNTAGGNSSTISGGQCSTISNAYATIGGGWTNTASGVVSTVSGGRCNIASGLYTSISGGRGNTSVGSCSNISGGISNVSGGNISFIGGGASNSSGGLGSSISGGIGNNSLGATSTIGGGQCNYALLCRATISGGYLNCIVNSAPQMGVTIGGGIGNNTCGGVWSGSNFTVAPSVVFAASFSTISGGFQNSASGIYATISGGVLNTASCYSSTISGGKCNNANGGHSTISGGYFNIASGYIATASGYCAIASGNHSVVAGGLRGTASGSSSTISGGYINTASGDYSVVGGGACNISAAFRSTVSGGYGNTIFNFNTVGGSSEGDVIGGGGFNCTGSSYNSFYNTISGGCGNSLYGGDYRCGNTISGGFGNSITGTETNFAVIGGGYVNTISGYGSGATILGGYNNTISQYSAFSGILGGQSNTISGYNDHSFILGTSLTSSATFTTYTNALSKTSGTFRINHPDPSKTATKYLQHSFVESPTRGDNIYRYVVCAVGCSASLELPSYYKFLNENDQVWVTPKNHFGAGYGVVDATQSCVTFTTNTDGEYNVLIIGTRKDVDAMNGFTGVEQYK